MPPALLALFAPRPPPTWKPPVPRRRMRKLTGVAALVEQFKKDEEKRAPVLIETLQQKKERLKKEKAESHRKVLAERTKQC